MTLATRLPNAGRTLGAIGALWVLAWTIRRSRRVGDVGKGRRRRAEVGRLLGSDRLAMVAHELRTPFGAIRHAATWLEATGDMRPEAKAACAIIRRQAEQVGRLLDDLLVPAGPETLTLDHQPIDLGIVVTEAVEGLRGIVEDRGHRLTLLGTPARVEVLGDASRLAQVVTNLVWNAAKFTPAGGHVQVSVGRDDDHVVLRVRDDGIGIAPAMTDRIFRLFAHAGPPGDHGPGIGLTLVRLIVARHGGDISVHSDGPGRGSEFVVRLPAADTGAA